MTQSLPEFGGYLGELAEQRDSAKWTQRRLSPNTNRSSQRSLLDAIRCTFRTSTSPSECELSSDAKGFGSFSMSYSEASCFASLKRSTIASFCVAWPARLQRRPLFEVTPRPNLRRLAINLLGCDEEANAHIELRK